MVHIGPTACFVVTDPEEVAKLISSRNRTANLPKLAEAYRILEAVGIDAAPCLCSDCVNEAQRGKVHVKELRSWPMSDQYAHVCD